MSSSAPQSSSGRFLSDFDYPLPKERIALYPLAERSAAKMLVVNRKDDSAEHRTFKDLPEYLKAGDVLVVNNTRVIPARLFGHRMTGSKAEVLLLKLVEKKADSVVWEALVKPSGKIKKSECFEVGQGAHFITVKAVDHPRKDDGRRLLEFETSDFPAFLEKAGHMPLPPYIHRDDEVSDREQYQTVYADKKGSVAAPTAGLHFDKELLEAIKNKGVEIVEVTLDVGYGTFQIMQAPRIRDHQMAVETFTISEAAAAAVNKAKKEGRRVIACGTTSVRTLEAAVNSAGVVESGQGATGLFIYSPYEFKVVDALITNFHFPKTSLLVLVSAFMGYEKTMDAYQTALDMDYRFASYGDGMFIQ